MLGIVLLAAAHPGLRAQEARPLTRLHKRRDCGVVNGAPSCRRLRPQRRRSHSDKDMVPDSSAKPCENLCCSAWKCSSGSQVDVHKDEQQLSYPACSTCLTL